MHDLKVEKPLWAWFVLIIGGLFLFMTLPGFFLFLFMPFWKPDEMSVFYFIYMFIICGIIIVVSWWLKRALYAIKTYNQGKIVPSNSSDNVELPDQVLNRNVAELNKPIWPWIVTVTGGLLLISLGPGIIMLPIMPLFLAGMSTDSGTIPDYIPFLIITIGYGLIVGYIILLVKAIKTLKK